VTTGPQEPLRFRTLGELQTESAPEPDWVWRGYLARETLTVLSGPPKVGKSSLVTALLEKVGRGAPFLDLPTKQTKAVYLSEERRYTLLGRARHHALPPDLEVLLFHESLGWAWPEVVGESVARATSSGAGLLVVDTFTPWAKIRGDAENEAGSVQEALDPLLHAAGRGLAVLVVHHHRKSGGEHGQALRGSSILMGTVDISIELERSGSGSSENQRTIKSLSRFEETPASRVIDREGWEYRVLGDSRTAIVLAEKERVIQAVMDLGTATRQQITDQTGLPSDTVARRTKELATEGRLLREGKGKRGDPFRYGVNSLAATRVQAAANESVGGDAEPDNSFAAEQQPIVQQTSSGSGPCPSCGWLDPTCGTCQGNHWQALMAKAIPPAQQVG